MWRPAQQVRSEFEAIEISNHWREIKENIVITRIWNGTTTSGSVIVSLARDIKANIDARTSGGRVKTDFEVTIRGELKKNKLIDTTRIFKTGTSDDPVNSILGILDEHNIHGRRNYIRLGANNENITDFSLSEGNRTISGEIHDISSAGLSFSAPESVALEINKRIKSMRFSLDSVPVMIDGTITVRRQSDELDIYVLMFSRECRDSIVPALNTYIFSSLQKKVLENIGWVTR